MKNVTVILIVDRMQQLMKDKDNGLKLDSMFYRTLIFFANLTFSDTFMIPVCTSTITELIDGVLRNLTRDRIYLPVPSLQLPNDQQEVPVFKNDKITNTIVENCGEHRRTLEVLNDCLNGHSIKECNVDTLMNDLCYNLTKKYCDTIFSFVKEVRPIARTILTRRLLNKYKTIPKTDKTPDEFVEGGMIRFEQIENTLKGYFTIPYIWL
ncbi:hypothetical protein C1646_803080 [Rhizophagus diaphanus]|nr:hypothetical protein C1646_803080 [Rhizophagus diaphanus] [Rhizophagus sp. MUCL 43196]